MPTPLPLPTFRLRCTNVTCALYHAPMDVPSYGEAHAFKTAHEWVWNGSESFPTHTAVIDEVAA